MNEQQPRVRTVDAVFAREREKDSRGDDDSIVRKETHFLFGRIDGNCRILSGLQQAMSGFKLLLRKFDT
jgi:hypothetical protein